MTSSQLAAMPQGSTGRCGQSRHLKFPTIKALFLTYLIAALQTIALSKSEGIAANLGAGVLGVLHASQPQPPPTESILTALLNEITTLPDNFVLVLDDYHVIEAKLRTAKT